jgi:membrane protein
MSTGDGRRADSPTDFRSGGWSDIAKRVVEEIKNDKVQVVSAGLAFYAMLAVFPALIAFVSIYGLVADPSTVTEQVSQLASNLSPGAETFVTDQMQQIVDSSSSTLSWAAAIAVLGALWTASSGAQQLIRAVDMAYDEEETRGFIRLRLVAVALTLAFFVLGAAAIAAIVVVPQLISEIAPAAWIGWVISIGRFLILGVLLLAVLAVIYRYAPDRDEPQWEWVSPGAIAATVVWIVASILFGWYVQSFGNFNATYGSLAGVIVLMLWFFISAFIVLLGAELNAESEHQTAHDTTDGRPQPMGERDAEAADSVAGSSRRR